ncbi:ABC transporter permease [Actinobaculum sp. 352]|uniref:ABC transporter permease n=1 Tax=Actinobaculum sp. 352 TaxID=2490946 RepID=UPI000F7EFE87|nr:ABC transporter permease [Actinobaculum sp. 352]RTE50325.1 ABC transporter [Actinobaculum sp. 352]
MSTSPNSSQGALTPAVSPASASATRSSVSWFTSMRVHAGRLLRRWSRSSTMITSTVGMPIVMVAAINIMFGGMVKEFSGSGMNPAHVAVMVAVSMAFTGAIMGAGSTVQERQEGLPDRLATMPGRQSASLAGRVVAESLRALITSAAALGVGFAYGADFGGVAGFAWTVLILALVAYAAGSIGSMLGYTVESPQGALSFSPLIMAAMFFNTAVMPREMYAPALRPVVSASPVTAVTQMVTDARNGVLDVGHLLVFTAWFGGMVIIASLVLARVASRRPVNS